MSKLARRWIPDKTPKEAMKLERFEIDIYQNHGLLADKTDKDKDFATVTTFFSYKEFKKSGIAETKNIRRVVTGPAGEVYHYHLNNIQASKDLFLKAWKHAKDKNLSHLTAFPYKPAYINEKLNEFIDQKYYGGAKEFAEKSNKDYANIHKEIRGKRKISHNQAIEYAKFLNVDPVDLLFEKQKTKVWASVNFLNRIGTSTDYNYRAGQLKFFGEDKFATVPRDIYRPNIRCVTVDTKGSHLDRQNLFYYKSDDKRPPNCHGKLCMLGVNVVFDGIIDYQEYFIGIYEESLGGKINLINPDPFAETRYILTDIQNVYAVAPIVAVINPSLIKQENNFEEIDFVHLADKIAAEEKQTLKIQNEVMKKLQNQARFQREYQKKQNLLAKKLTEMQQKEIEEEKKFLDLKMQDLIKQYEIEAKKRA